MQTTVNKLNSHNCATLSEYQQAAWFLHKLSPEGYSDKLAFAVRIKFDIDVALLKAAFYQLVEIYPCLRSKFFADSSNVFVSVCDIDSLSFEVVDASEWEDTVLEKYLDEFTRVRFDLESGLVVRLSLIQKASDWILVLGVHCCVCDELSLLMLVDELLRLYEKPQSLVLFDRKTFLEDNESLKLECDYWKNILTPPLPLLNLPNSKTRPPIRSYEGSSLSWTMVPELHEKLKHLADLFDVDLSVLLLSVLNVLLYRYTGEADIIVAWQHDARTCTSFSTKKYTQINNKIGNFTNYLPLRAHVSDSLSFNELCSTIQQVLNEAKPYQDYPFPRLVRASRNDADIAYPPICQVGFAFQDLNQLEFEYIPNLFVNDSKYEYFPLPKQRVEFDINLEVSSIGKSVICAFNYNTALFDPVDVIHMVEHFQNLLHSITTNFQAPISHLDLLNESESQKILFEWNDTQTNYNLSYCLHELVAIQVEKTPNNIAVKYQDKELTYSQLNARANQLARYLQSLGVQKEDLVGICLERSIEMVVGLLAILKAGGAYVPIDPGYPQERIKYMLEDSQVSVLLTQSQLVKSLPMLPVYTLALDSEWEKVADIDDSNLNAGVTPDNLAYVIYTSGSTGKPKGAMNTHRGICNRLLWMQDTYSLTQQDCVIQKTPFSFDVSVWEFFWTLITGAKLVMAEPGGHRDSSYLVKTILNEGVTTLHFVPSMLQVFLETKGIEACRSIKRVICSGEALPLELQTRFFAKLNCELHNLYGPTEAAIDVTHWQCQPDTSLSTVPIGRPIANTQIYILDRNLQPVPTGVVGELYIGGVGVARGYWNRPDLSAEKFIQNPYSPGKIYKTGDLARFLADGTIEYIGRIDHQVKIRGFRIELGEIENALTQHPQVSAAVVLPFYHSLKNQQLIAYFVSQSKKIQSKLRSFLKERLPEFMIPSAFIALNELPLTPNGKVDRRALPEVQFDCLNRGDLLIPPRNDLEHELVNIWTEVLCVSSVGVQDNFFEIGGNSLSAVHLVSAIYEKFGREIPLASLFTNSTIEQLAEVLLNSSCLPNSPIVAIQPNGTRRPFFCVHPAGGHVLCYFQLSRYLGKEQPFYGLQARGFYGDEEPLTTVKEMASLYVKSIQTVQKEGPYQVGGWSFGGVVAYEVAQQLIQQGHEVSLLAILDSYVPILLDKAKPIDNKYLVGVLSRVFGGMFGKDNLVTPEELANLTIEERLDYIIDKAREAKIFPPGVEQQNNRRILDVLVGTLKATYYNQRQYYPGKVTVFRANSKHVMAPDPTMVWVELFSVLDAEDVEICDVPGNHYTFILEPHVKVLAEKLSQYLRPRP
ncbi:MAG: amino acid adenylation domain-containing protein [Calothrix sp. C42_A2020_038]|nr:amino acid adenylation domain-containing protein [Calothrix sp. C42_A2020_038]